jgi:hypothetical protein
MTAPAARMMSPVPLRRRRNQKLRFLMTDNKKIARMENGRPLVSWKSKL